MPLCREICGVRLEYLIEREIMKDSQTPVLVSGFGTSLLVYKVRVGEHGYFQQVEIHFSIYACQKTPYIHISKIDLCSTAGKYHLPVLFSLDSTQNQKHSLN